MHRILLALVVCLSLLAPARKATALTLPWYDGVFKSIGTNTACLSDPPIFQVRVQAYAGYTLLPPNRTPAVGEVFYTHLVISHPGNPCGGSVVGLELMLPEGVTPAVSEGNPVFCFARVPNGPRIINLGNDSGYGCPQTFTQGLEGLAIRAPRGGYMNSFAWGMAQGVWLEFLIPLTSSTPQFGDKQITFRVNPDIGVVGYPSVPLLVNNDVLFRTSDEGNHLTLDLCAITPVAQGCQ
ncbi:hypothetical protein [Tahibacter amnicola]|uniref:Secreted protein n=1 Tax=Tahibacter amnicola TaxID=2976241 RepID=A0ABY6BFQ1_9GAMM|nr:hypothetical protein [Tahibacter amnicola]UXI67436.1 hypothetical protein N4264_22295 [Tahibacter amnicola]